SLPAALGAVRGQTVLLTGRIEGRLLYVQPASGPERSVLLPDLFKAAEDADVNLIVLHSTSTPRQPGGRNWLWQRVQVKGLEQAMQHTRFADFLNALAGSGSRLLVSAAPSGKRTALAADAAVGLPGGAPTGGLFSGLIADVTGRVTIAGLQADMLSAQRQRELDRRLIAGIPSDIQTGYLLLAFLGLLGLPVSRAWWQLLWPRESAAEYALRSGYWAARIVRGGAFLLLFLPLTAPATAPSICGGSCAMRSPRRRACGAGSRGGRLQRAPAPDRARAPPISLCVDWRQHQAAGGSLRVWLRCAPHPLRNSPGPPRPP